MSLKTDIVLVNEYTVPLPKSQGTKANSGPKHAGSRGGSPGDYVLRYMARDGATESLAPIRKQRIDQFVERYMAREQATEALDVTSPAMLKRRMSKAQGLGGVAFGYGQVSLSHDQLKAASKDIQALFDGGHTVMKTVLSFSEDYLRRHGIVSQSFAPTRKGSYRGRIDQMKLRLAVMSGLERTGRMLYDDLRYVAVIQVDTLHVHVHLAMVDAGPGTLAPDGTQKGKINEQAKSLIRRGIDGWLDDKKHVKHLASAVGYERRNVTTFVKRWAHQQMLHESLPQFLLACLPADRRLWRDSTNNKSMAKPNRIVREIVESVLAQPDSPFQDAMVQVREYANQRRRNEGLSRVEWNRLVRQGREQIVERSMNGVYALLRQLPEDALRIRTPMLEIMGLDYEDMAAQAAARSNAQASRASDDLVGFGFRLRSYSSRLEHHTTRREYFHDRVRIWESANAAGAASTESVAVYRFYLEEEQYHARVSAKYRSLLNFLPNSASWTADLGEVSAYGERLISLESLRKDQTLRKTKDPQEAERQGRDIYGQSGGALVSFGDRDSLAELDRRIDQMREQYARKVDSLRVSLASKGLRLELVETPVLGDDGTGFKVVPGAEFEFEDVKALDLHHMRFDFARDVEVGPRGRGLFVDWSAQRAVALGDAIAYLESSGQGHEVVALESSVVDITRMQELATRFLAGADHLPSEVSALAGGSTVRRSPTVRLSTQLQQQLAEQVAVETRQATRDLEAGKPLLELEQEPSGPAFDGA